MDVKRVLKKIRLSTYEAVQYQILTELFLKKIYLNQSDVEILSLLGLWGPSELNTFCENASSIVYNNTERIMARIQNVRNRLVVLEKKGVVIKELTGKKKKSVRLVDDITVINGSRLLLDFNLLAIDTDKKKTTS